jgi:hypothetical protein
VTGIATRTLPNATTSAAGVMSSTDKTKLDGIATGATANSTDATLLARANHTGTQLASTISDFSTAVAATASVTANTAKVTNATHTGEVTGATALTITALAVTSGKIANSAVTFAKFQDMAALSILGRDTNTTGITAAITASTDDTVLRRVGSALSFGAISGSMISANTVTNSNLSNMTANTIKGRITASTGAPEDLSASNVRTIIELAAPIYIQTATPTASVTHALWYDIN